MGIFLSNKKKNELMLVFDVGSSRVSGALFLAQDSGIPKIIFSASELIQAENKIDIDRFLVLTMQSLQNVVNKIYTARLGAPSHIFCVLSSPWCASQTRTVSLKKNVPFPFTAKLADELIKKEIKIFEEEHSDKNTNVSSPIRTIELKNIKTILNGYETPKPLNQKTKELEMTVFVSMSGEQVLNKIEDVIGQHFYSRRIKFSSFTMASFTAVRDMNVDKENFLLVDIGGEVTDISMVKKNTLRESVSFPLGRNFLIRGIAVGLGCSLSEANSLFSLLKDGHAEDSVAKSMSVTVNQLKSEWLKKFQESLANLSNDISIPSAIYLTIDKEMADFFSEIIKTEQFNQYTLTESKFEIIVLDTQLFHGLAVFEEPAVRDPNLIIDSIYINRFLAKI
jgi:cell division ATPase FtsA